MICYLPFPYPEIRNPLIAMCVETEKMYKTKTPEKLLMVRKDCIHHLHLVPLDQKTPLHLQSTH
jgi:hypothetical protein